MCCHFCELKTKLSRGFEIKKWLHHFLIWYKSALVGDALFFKIMSNLLGQIKIQGASSGGAKQHSSSVFMF